MCLMSNTPAAPTSGDGGFWSGIRAALPRNVLVLGLVSLLTDASSDMIVWTTPFFIALLGGGFVWVGIVEGLREGVASLATIGAGFLSDRSHKRKVFVGLGYGLSTLVKPLLALAGVPWHVAALNGLERVGKGIRGAPRDALVAEAVDAAHRGRAFSFHRMMDHAGAAVGQVAGLLLVLFLFPYFHRLAEQGSAWVKDASDVFRCMYLVSAVPAALAVLAIVLLVREQRGEVRKKVELHFRAAYDRRFWWLLGAVVLFTLGNSSDMFLMLRAGQILGYPVKFTAAEHEMIARQWNFPWQLPALFFVLSLAKMIFTLPGGLLADRIGRARTLVLGWAVYAVVYILFGLASEAWQVWALFVAYGLFYGFTEGVQKAVVADFVRPEVRGAAYGLSYFSEGIVKLIASPLFGALWAVLAASLGDDRGAAVAFGFGGVCAAAACVLLVIALRRLDRRAATA